MSSLHRYARQTLSVVIGALALSPMLGAIAEPAASPNVVPGERIAQFARQQVLAELAALGWRAEVDVIQTPRDVLVRGARATLELRPHSLGDGASRAARHVTARVDISDASSATQSIPVSLEVTTLGQAARVSVAGVSQSAGTPTPSKDTALAGAVDRAGSFAASGTLRVPASRPAAPALLIHRGDYATLRATDGAIEIESRAQALEDGGPGQTIQVRLASGTDPVLARVTSHGQLELRQ